MEFSLFLRLKTASSLALNDKAILPIGLLSYSAAGMNKTQFQAFRTWLDQVLGGQPFELAPLTGDAGGRRYFRLGQIAPPQLAVSCADPQKELLDFDRIGQLLEQAGVWVPRPRALDAQQGFMVIPDFGDRLLTQVGEPERGPWYAKAIALLPHIQSVQARLPRADLAFVARKRSLFEDWYLGRHLGLEVPEGLLDPLFSTLFDNFFGQPQVPSHRDFHGRNLICHGDRLAVIDFQDLLLAPLTYDAASLLRDSYVELDDDLEAALLRQAFEQQRHSGDFRQFRRWLDLTAMLRQLKILGIFCRLHYQDGKSRYLDSLAPTRASLLKTARRYPEFAAFVGFMEANT